jgi:hypothetical protein
MTRFPDAPQLVSASFLREIDKDPPGSWIASKKWDGFRRVADNTSGRWVYQARHTKGPAAIQMPTSLTDEFESLPWPDGICLDAEWVGPRVASVVKEHSLHIFDLLMWRGEWLGNVPYWRRQQSLWIITTPLIRYDDIVSMPPGPHPQELSPHVSSIPVWQNPGLYDRYVEQLADPLSEGICVRHKDSLLVGGFNSCKVGDRFFKCRYR